MMMNAMIEAVAWVAIASAAAGSHRNAAADQARQRRLADPAQAQRGEGDPQLGGRDVAVE